VLATSDLIQTIERSEAERLRSSAIAAGGDVLDCAGGIAAFCGDGSPLTQVAAVGIESDVSEADLDRVFAFFHGRASEFEFKLSVLSQAPLREAVLKRARSLPEFESLLACDLESWEPSKVEYEFRLVTPENAEEYAARSVERFFSGGPGPPGLAEVIAAGCRTGSAIGYEVWVEGRPAAGCGLGLSKGVAWLQGAATHPKFRNRGLHKAMQNYRMRVAKERGFALMAQGALPGSASQLNAQKSGLGVICTRPTFMLAP
jgi:hypothetical protein